MKKDMQKALEYLIYVGQLGLDLIMPSLLCLGAAWYIDNHFHWGVWVYVVGLGLGLAAGGMTFMKFYRRVVMKGLKKPDKKNRKRVSFSKHV